MRNFHILLSWLTLPVAFLIPEPDYMSYVLQELDMSKGSVLPNIPGC